MTTVPDATAATTNAPRRRVGGGPASGVDNNNYGDLPVDSGSVVGSQQPTTKSRRNTPHRRSRRNSVVYVVLVSICAGWIGYLGTLLLRGSGADREPSFSTATATATSDGGVRSLVAPADTRRPVVAYAISITHCQPRRFGASMDGAAVLAHSIRKSSYPLHPTSRYESKLYVFFDQSSAPSCPNEISTLTKLGYDVQLRDVPVPLSEMASEHPNSEFANEFRKRMKSDGCCGEKELLKLWTYGLTGHDVAVHLDLDSMLLRPLDELYDAMGNDVMAPDVTEKARKRLIEERLVAPTFDVAKNFPEDIDAFYTKDYNMVKPGELNVGIQGGFLVVKPDLSVLETFQSILRKADFVFGRGPGKGWGGSGYSLHIYGAMTVQGLLPYYYDVVRVAERNVADAAAGAASAVAAAAGAAAAAAAGAGGGGGQAGGDATGRGGRGKGGGVELHRCKFNQMADNPRATTHRFPRSSPLPGVTEGQIGFRDTTCRDGRSNCDDVNCQRWPINDVRSVHYNFCRKPWSCELQLNLTVCYETCLDLTREWFAVRKDMEDAVGTVASRVDVKGTFHPEHFLGYCDVGPDPNGAGTYTPMMLDKT